MENNAELKSGQQKDNASPLNGSNGREYSNSSGFVEASTFYDSLKQTIANYERLLMQEKIQGKPSIHTEKLLSALREELANYTKTKVAQSARDAPSAVSSIRSSNGKTPSLAIKDKALHEIFHFYTKQSALAHVKKTFEAVQIEKDTMSLGYFFKFIKDFAIQLDQKVLL